jgi:hypothetical protein
LAQYAGGLILLVTGGRGYYQESGKPFIVPISEMDRLEYLDDNIKSVDISLTADDLQEIENRLADISIQGERLSKELLSLSEE